MLQTRRPATITARRSRASPSGQQEQDARSTGAIRTRRTRLRPPTRTTVVKVHSRQQHQQAGGRHISMPSWLDYCFEYEVVALRSVNKDNNTACLKFSLVTVVRIQGDAPSRRRTSSTDAAKLLDRGASWPPFLLLSPFRRCFSRAIREFWSPDALQGVGCRLHSTLFVPPRVDIAACSKDLPAFCRARAST